jgi:hypothetical protein
VTIQLTPEQREQLQIAKASLPQFALSTEQRARMKEAIAQEVAGRQANEMKLGKLLTAEQEPGFSGSLRRAISAAQVPITGLAESIAIDPRQLDAFRTGEATLPSDVVDRLVDVLHLRLVEETAPA